MCVEILVGCHSASFKNEKTAPLPLSKRNLERFVKKYCNPEEGGQ
jgi:hypothetical protein